jgi:hypothetical protein
MAKELVPPVEPAGIGPQKPFHSQDQIGLRSFDHQMKMISHQTPGVDLPVRFCTGLAERLEEPLSIQIVVENGFAPIAAIHDVVDGAGILDAQLATHAPALPQAATKRQGLKTRN